MERYDYACDDDGDLLFENGDLVVKESTQQHIEDHIDAEKGDYREIPELGAAPRKHIEAPVTSLNEFLIDIRKSLKLDKFVVKQLKFIDGEVIVDAK